MAKANPVPLAPPPPQPPIASGVVGARIRERRRACGLSLAALAARTNLTPSFLSLIERDRNSPSLESLRRIAEALEVPLFYFTESQGENPVVVRHDQRIHITFPPGNLTCELLVPDLRHRMEMFLAHAKPSAGNIARAPKHDSEECLYLMAGRLRVRLDGTDHVLEAGDSIYFHGRSLQEICALGRREATFISVITPPVL